MIGIDIADLSRIDPEDERFIRHVLTEDEQQELAGKKTAHRRREYIGGRFAAKEAIFKASGRSDCFALSILNDETGKPYVKDHPELEISISHDGGYAVAAALWKKGMGDV